MDKIINFLDRRSSLFESDVSDNELALSEIISQSSFMVIGGAGSIGQAVVKEVFKRNPKKLHVVDISENNLVELVRDLRSEIGYIDGEFKTFAIDCGSVEFKKLIKEGAKYDYFFNLSALKHVRSESNEFSLMRMIQVNILNTITTIDDAISHSAKKYFCVSTDKAANPVNMMGASKRIMEKFLIQKGSEVDISTARFANVAFSDGSLLHGFNQRFLKRQPISAPNDVERYFITPKESGELCMLSCLLGKNKDIFFPKLDENLDLIRFDDIAIKYLNEKGYEPYSCQSEDEARNRAEELIKKKKWPCYFFKSDTTGEKGYEEFFTSQENTDLDSFKTIGIVKNDIDFNDSILDEFLADISHMRSNGKWTKSEIVSIFNRTLENFNHLERNKYLDDRM